MSCEDWCRTCEFSMTLSFYIFASILQPYHNLEIHQQKRHNKQTSGQHTLFDACFFYTPVFSESYSIGRCWLLSKSSEKVKTTTKHTFTAIEPLNWIPTAPTAMANSLPSGALRPPVAIGPLLDDEPDGRALVVVRVLVFLQTGMALPPLEMTSLGFCLDILGMC